MLHLWKKKSVRVLAIIVVLVGLYAILGFVVAPKLVRSAIVKDIPQTLGVTAAVGDIHINPFLFQVTVNQFSLAGKGGERLLGFERLFVDFELSSIWHRAYSFGNIDIDSPYVSAAVAPDGSLNLMQLKPKAAPAAQPAGKSEPLPAIRIGSFKVSQGSVAYDDHSRPDAFAARLEPINFELREFTTGVEGGKFTFTGSSILGERLEWHGHLSVQPIESDGEFRVDGLQVHTLWSYLEDKLNFAVNSGTIALAANYKFSAGNGNGNGTAAAPPGEASAANLQLDLSRVTVSNLTVRPKASDTDWITVPEFAVTGTSVDLAKRQAHVDLVALTGIKLLTWLEPDGSVNLMKLAAAPPPAAPAAAPNPATAAAPTVTASSTPAISPGAPWQFDVRQLDIREASIAVEDRTTRPAVKVLLAPFALQVNGISQDLSKPLSVALETRINERGSLQVNGEVTPQPALANLSVKLAGVELAAVQPYIAQHSSMTLLRGSLGGEGKLHYGAQPNMPAMQFAGNIDVEQLHTVDDLLRDDFINWERLDILGLNFSQKPDRLDIEQILVRKPYARVIIESDESLNVKRVLAVPGTAASEPPVAAQPVAAVPAPASKPAGKRRRDGKPASDAPASTAAGSEATMPISVKKVLFQAGQAKFSDLSVKPNFSAGIQALHGSVTGLSSKPNSRAKVDLHGSIDAFSPVSITGEFNVLGPRLYTDIAMDFRNMELTIFNPYSGKFAGYNISKGKLTTELHYKVDGRKLDAQHHIVIDQLEFGEKTASKDAVSLPIKLAVSLLKDRNGVIDLSIPVTGSLDDPKFRLAPIIWKVFVNILEKAITAPFALLGSLFGGGPDIQFIDFQPGVATLDAPATDKVKSVAKALIERPQLKIEVPIGFVAELDGPALVDTAYKAQISAAQQKKGAPKKAAGAAGTAPPFDQLDATTQVELLSQVYAKDFGAEPKYPDTVTGLKSKPDVLSGKIDFLSKAIREHLKIEDSELRTLGQQRAQALQQVLLADPQVTADRVFLVANDKATSKDGAVRLELSLQ